MANDRIGYCEPADLYITGTRLPKNGPITPESAINAASDEIDSEIGQLYETPILTSETDEEKRDDSLLLKNICASLATGRLITSMAAGGEQSQMHDYGKYLINFAYARIKQLVTGARDLTSAIKKPQPEEDLMRKGPIAVHGDAYSLVDNFYENFQPTGYQPQHWVAPSNADETSPWPGSRPRYV